jgi:hypothetical protein
MGEHQASAPNATARVVLKDEVMQILKVEPALSKVIVERCKRFQSAVDTCEHRSLFTAADGSAADPAVRDLCILWRHGE